MPTSRAWCQGDKGPVIRSPRLHFQRHGERRAPAIVLRGSEVALAETLAVNGDVRRRPTAQHRRSRPRGLGAFDLESEARSSPGASSPGESATAAVTASAASGTRRAWPPRPAVSRCRSGLVVSVMSFMERGCVHYSWVEDVDNVHHNLCQRHRRCNGRRLQPPDAAQP